MCKGEVFTEVEAQVTAFPTRSWRAGGVVVRIHLVRYDGGQSLLVSMRQLRLNCTGTEFQIVRRRDIEEKRISTVLDQELSYIEH